MSKLDRMKEIWDEKREEKRVYRIANIFMGVVLVAVMSFGTWQYLQKVRYEHELAEYQRLSASIRTLQAEEERQKIVRLDSRDLSVYNIKVRGTEVTGYVKNFGSQGVGDITLKALWEAGDGTVHVKTQTFASLDGWPLTRGQMRPFRIVLDEDPVEGGKVAVVIDGLTFVE